MYAYMYSIKCCPRFLVKLSLLNLCVLLNLLKLNSHFLYQTERSLNKLNLTFKLCLIKGLNYKLLL